jgi:hypothetical protein
MEMTHKAQGSWQQDRWAAKKQTTSFIKPKEIKDHKDLTEDSCPINIYDSLHSFWI